MTKWQKPSLSRRLAESQYSRWPTPGSFAMHNFKDFNVGSNNLLDVFFPVTTTTQLPHRFLPTFLINRICWIFSFQDSLILGGSLQPLVGRERYGCRRLSQGSPRCDRRLAGRKDCRLSRRREGIWIFKDSQNKASIVNLFSPHQHNSTALM